MAGMASSRTESVPRWLEADEMQAWLAFVPVLSWLPYALDAQLQRDGGLTHFEYGVLAALSDAPDRMLLMRSLAELANGSLSRLSHVVSRLEKRGWVRRELCPTDGRSTYAVLTDEGHTHLVATAPGYVANVRRLVIDRLDPAQLEQLTAIGRALQRDDGRAER